jgi:predicted transcriptional regulator
MGLKMTRRDKLDIMREILSLCKKKEMKKTRIAYVLNLNFQKASEYLDWLISHDLVHEEKNGIYKTTPAGDSLWANLEGMNEGSLETNSEYDTHI